MQEQRTAEQVAWAAGLFEGEGCVNAYPRGNKKGVQIRLAMTDSDVVERFARIVGVGNVSVKDCDAHRAKGYKPLYSWVAYEAEKVCEVIELLLPWLGDRRRARALEVLAIARDTSVYKGKRTHCPHGHPYAGDNLILEPYKRDGATRHARRCRACRERQAQERRARRA